MPGWYCTWGLDDQDPNDWDDMECMAARDRNVPVAIKCSSDSDDGGENVPAHDPARDLNIPAATTCSSNSEMD